MGDGIRLDKYLCEMGRGSRKEIKEAARKGRVLVNGAVEKQSDRKIDPGMDTVVMDGTEVGYVKYEYIMLNKPQGVVSATADSLHDTVLDLIADKKRGDLFPVGRLDIDTEGLLLLTNDGDLAHRLLSPKKHVDKVYEAVVEGWLPQDAVSRFEEGIILEDGTKTRPAVLELLNVRHVAAGGRDASDDGRDAADSINESADDGRDTVNVGHEAADGNRQSGGAAVSRGEPLPAGDLTVRLTIREGKFHQVKRMFEALGCRVVYLKRLSMGTLRLDPALKPGEYRPLTEAEAAMLRDGRNDEGKNEAL